MATWKDSVLSVSKAEREGLQKIHYGVWHTQFDIQGHAWYPLEKRTIFSNPQDSGLLERQTPRQEGLGV